MRPPFEMSTAKNAVMSATRIACCMLWVTIAIVYSFFSSSISSSMRRVAIGSRAEHGSSIEQHRRLGCDRARNAQALLLATG